MPGEWRTGPSAGEGGSASVGLYPVFPFNSARTGRPCILMAIAAMLEARVAITPQALAAAVVQRLYGYRPTALKPLGAGRHVFLAEFGGLPAKIVKLAGDVRGVQREQKILRALRRPRWRMPVPALELPAKQDPKGHPVQDHERRRNP